MGKVAIVENEEIVYRGGLPNVWNNITGLKKSEGNWEFLNPLGIFPLEVVEPEFDSATHKIEGYTDDIQESKVVQTWTVRAKTQEELDVEAAAKAVAYKELRRMAHLPIGDQLDMMYWNMDEWRSYVTAIKERYSKPRLPPVAVTMKGD